VPAQEHRVKYAHFFLQHLVFYYNSFRFLNSSLPRIFLHSIF
jgi:hypothetical protein